MQRVLSLDTGHLTDEELGLDTNIRRQMCDLPTARNERVKVLRNGHIINHKRR